MNEFIEDSREWYKSLCNESVIEIVTKEAKDLIKEYGLKGEEAREFFFDYCTKFKSLPISYPHIFMSCYFDNKKIRGEN